MQKTINIIDEEFKLIVDYYNKTINDFDLEIQNLEQKIADLTNQKKKAVDRMQELLTPIQIPISEVTKGQIDIFKSDAKEFYKTLSNSFNLAAKLPQKIDFIYSIKRQEFSTREIFDILSKLDDSFREKEKTTIEAISYFLSRAVRDGKYKVGLSTDAKGKKRFKKI